MFTKQFFQWLQKAMFDSNIRKQLKNGASQADMFPNTKVGPNIPPMYKHQEAKRAIHSVDGKGTDKFKGTDIIKEAGYKGPSLDKVKGTTYEYSSPQQLDLFKALKSILEKKE